MGMFTDEVLNRRFVTMMGYGFGMGVGGWIGMAVFWIALIALVVWLAVRALPGTRRDDADAGAHPGAARSETPQDVLDRRLAAGEIDTATYESVRTSLRATRTGE